MKTKVERRLQQIEQGVMTLTPLGWRTFTHAAWLHQPGEYVEGGLTFGSPLEQRQVWTEDELADLAADGWQLLRMVRDTALPES